MTGKHASSRDRAFARGLARAFAGAIIFGFPLMMTMEMWSLGFYMDRSRLVLFMVLNMALMVPLSRFIGFEETHLWIEDVLDALTAYGVAIIASATMLAVLAIITVAMPIEEILGKIAIQSVPASIGAIVARGQLGSETDERAENDRSSYHFELVLMTVGALFLAFTVAPTEEMIAIAFKMTPWHALALVALSVGALHAFVYALDFAGQEKLPEGMTRWTGILVYSLAGYGIAIIVSVYVLWTFGRTDGAAFGQIAHMVSVLAFPAALGAGSARLIV